MRGVRKVARNITEVPDGARLKLGTITAYSVGPPRTVNATVDGVAVTGIPVLDSCACQVSTNIWLLSMGKGRLLGIGQNNGSPGALGLVKRIGFANTDINPPTTPTITTLALDSAFVFTFIQGRRYKIGLNMRALRSMGQAAFTVLVGGVPWSTLWVTTPGGWNYYDLAYFHDGDNVTRTLTLTVEPAAAGTIAGVGNYMYILDLGAQGSLG